MFPKTLAGPPVPSTWIAVLFTLTMLAFAFPAGAATLTYSQNFVAGTVYPQTSVQVTSWNSFRASLPASAVTSIRIYGSLNPAGVSCTTPSLAQQIADNLRNGATSSVNCGGSTYSTGLCGITGVYSVEIAIGVICRCEATIAVRPAIGNANWGGISGASCPAATQTMSVDVTFATATNSLSASVAPATISTSPAVLAYSFSVTHVTGASIATPSLTATLAQNGSPRSFASGPTLSSGDANANGQIDAGETWVYSASYAVGQSDIDNGGALLASASFAAPGGPTTLASAQAVITQSPSLSVTKTATLVKAPGNSGAHAETGDTINYAYVATNTGNLTLTSVRLNDMHEGHGAWSDPIHISLQDNGAAGNSPDSSPDPAVWGSVAPGDAVNFAASYTVTQQDIDMQ